MTFSDKINNNSKNNINNSQHMDEIIDYGKNLGLDLKNPLLRKVFLLGYEVGYFKHNEYVEWIVTLKQTLHKKCQETGFENDFEKYYEMGKSIGKKEDDRVLQSLNSKFDNEQESEPILAFLIDERESPTFLNEPDQIRYPKVTKKPPLLDNPKQIGPPGVINFFGKRKKKKGMT